MQQPIIKGCFADNGGHSHWELINSETGEKLWTEYELNKRVEYVPIKSIAQGSICYDDFRNEKTIFVAKDKILFKTEIETFRMPLSGQRTDKKYFVIVLDNSERIFCNETEFNNI